MQEIDILELSKDLKKTRYQRLLHNKHAISSGCIIAANTISLCISDYALLKALFCLTIGFEASQIRRQWLKENYNEEEQIADILKKSQTYIDCKSEYNFYIEEVAKLIKRVGLTSSKETIIYLQTLLDSGHFSKYMRHQYKRYQNEKDYLVDILGARVLSGTSVCRHMSSFTRDVMNCLGYTAANISAVSTTSNPVKIAQKDNVEWNHSVTAVTENGKMYLFDPTCGMFSSLPKDISFTEPESVKVSQFVIPGPSKYLVMNPNSKILNPDSEKELQRIFTSKQDNISFDEYMFYKTKAEIIYHGNIHNQFSFFQNQEERRSNIEHLYQELCPYSDKPIKKWLVRK